jgi:hypothetical protein
MPVASLQHQLTTAADDPLADGRILRHYGRLQRGLATSIGRRRTVLM